MGTDLNGKIAAITGGASGIGLATAEALLDSGATVVLVDRDAAALEKLREGVTGIQNGLTEAAITLEFSELLDPYPDVSVQVANLGGALAYYQGRWAHTEHRLFPDRPSWDGRLRRILVDTGSLGARAISFAAEVADTARGWSPATAPRWARPLIDTDAELAAIANGDKG